ncbi:MAG: hypothetical protein IJT90_00660 [Bacteroidaceae bacterium]|nr:hypothetical protein [Bacteroidaceae bacterium]
MSKLLDLHKSAVENYKEKLVEKGILPSINNCSSKRGIDIVINKDNTNEEYYIIKATAKKEGAFTAMSENVWKKISAKKGNSHIIIARLKENKQPNDEDAFLFEHMTPEEFRKCKDSSYYMTFKYFIGVKDIEKAKKTKQ